MKANPDLSEVITEAIGDSWMAHATDLLRLTNWEADPVFAEKVAMVKLPTKNALPPMSKKQWARSSIPIRFLIVRSSASTAINGKC
jgi:starch phosphorylase